METRGDDGAAGDGRPYTRWWWFAGPIEPRDVEAQLGWLRDHGFGGVEIAWVYNLDDRPGPRWRSPEWSAAVAHAKKHAERLGLGCDFTFGSLWPFGGYDVPLEDSHQTFEGPTWHPLHYTWESGRRGEPGLVLDHLNREALARYARRMGDALAPALEGRTSALFCDSWEVPSERVWSPALTERFRARFGYDLVPLADALEEDDALRYDYRAFLADAVLDEFFRPFTEVCHALGARSRVQCHGAPTDLLAAYAAVDVPESEALLFPPHFSRIAASAAALAGRPVVSCETFTCLYGFPDKGMGEEQTADLALLADAVLANGVNQVVWHGTPYNPLGGSNRFFATTHVGPDSPFAADLPRLNAYLTRACRALRRGRTCSNLAVYLPLEDNRMLGRLPRAERTPGGHSYWELRHVAAPEVLERFQPLWVSAPFLEAAAWDGPSRTLRTGAAEFQALLADVQWMDRRGLDAILRLARAGLPVVMPRPPSEPGRRRSDGYEGAVEALLSLANVHTRLNHLGASPLVVGDDAPPFWARRDGNALLVFFAHPGARGVRYPMPPGYASTLGPERREVEISAPGGPIAVTLDFPARGGSALVEVSGRAARTVDLGRP
ncbi:MAG: glycosyl hydrolase [Isosphaeraceae bacterium]